MTVELSSNKNREPERDQDGLCQPSAAELLVRNVVKSCKAMSSYEAASSLLLEMIEVTSKDAAALAELIRGKEEVRLFFEQRNTPQPSTKIEGCNFYGVDQIAVGNSNTMNNNHKDEE